VYSAKVRFKLKWKHLLFKKIGMLWRHYFRQNHSSMRGCSSVVFPSLFLLFPPLITWSERDTHLKTIDQHTSLYFNIVLFLHYPFDLCLQLPIPLLKGKVSPIRSMLPRLRNLALESSNSLYSVATRLGE